MKKPIKGPLPLDLFVPDNHTHEYTVILTNKKTQAQMDDVPTQTKNGNQFYWLATIFAHNLTRKLPMRTQPKERTTTPKRATLWVFEKMGTLHKKQLSSDKLINI